MTNFKYAAKDNAGKTVEGTIQANDKNEAVAELRKKNLVAMRVDEAGAFSARASNTKRGGFFAPKAKASNQELVIFTRQLATMLGAGLALLESLEVLGDQAESPGLKMTCHTLLSEVRGGSDLSAAMAKCPKAFDELYVAMVKAGEVSGQMDIILERLADYQEASESLRREIKAAMTYPVISMILVLGITAFLMLGVVPGFRAVFDSLDSELPAITKFVLETAEWMKANVITWVLGSEGASVNQGDELARVADLARFKVEATLSDAYSARIRPGQPAFVNAGGVRLAGRVARVLPTVENGTLSLEIALDEKSHPALRHNLRVEAHLVVDQQDDALRLVRGSILTVDNNQYVFVRKGNRAIRTLARFGRTGWDATEVLEGLADGDEVILSDMSDHASQKEVRIQ